MIWNLVFSFLKLRDFMLEKSYSSFYAGFFLFEVLSKAKKKRFFPRWGPGNKFKKNFSKKSHSAENDSFNPFPIFIHCRTHSARAQNRKIVRSQSESSTKNPHTSSTNQNRARKIPFNSVSQSESSNTSTESSANQNRVLRHPRALGYGWRPFSALGLTRLAIAFFNT